MNTNERMLRKSRHSVSASQNTNNGNLKKTGEGMGLAYVKTLVRFLGGRIWCSSELGAGTTFSVSLPVPVDEFADNMPLGGRS